MGRAKRKKHPCPHCGKTFRGVKGFQYHIDEYVCRQSERPGGPVIKGKRKMTNTIDDENDVTNSAVVVPENNDRQSERPGGLVVRGKRKVRKIQNDDTDAVSENNDKEELDQADDDEPITKAITIKSTATKKQHKKIRGSLKDRTCPICKNVFTSIAGKTYHFSKYIYFYIIFYS